MVNRDSLILAGTVSESVVDGPGLRFTVFTQGCPHACKGCHNPHTQPFEGGETWLVQDLANQVLANPLLTGVTFSGGEPFAQAVGLTALAHLLKPKKLNIITYTGYTYEEILQSANDSWQALLQATDILIDGPFVDELKNLNLPFRGSGNQRVIDVAKSLQAGAVVEVEF